MLNFHLFKVKVYPSKQISLFDKEKSPSEILRETILSFPSAELRKGKVWHIGNVTSIDNFGMYFRVGRMVKSKIEIYQNGNFLDEQFESAPYTHGLLDVDLELFAIAKKTRLSPKPKGIANQLVRLLNQSEKGRQLEARFEISEINDPEDFITHIRKAYLISKFWITFSRPNPFDSDDFIKPMEKLLTSVNGERGKAELQGENLNVERIENMARSAATTGEDAGALLQIEPQVRKVRKKLRGNPVVLLKEDLLNEKDMDHLIQQMREVYNKLRGIIEKGYEE